MKIIKKTDTATWNYPYTCSKCDTEMLVEKGDLVYKYLEPDRPGGNGDGVFSFYCLECHDKVRMLTDRIPKMVQIEVKKGLPAVTLEEKRNPYDDYGNDES